MVWNKGNKPWNTGKKWSPEVIEKFRISHLGHKHTEEQKIKIGLKSKGHKVTEEMRKKISKANSGSKCGAWKGGVTGLNELIRKCRHFRDWRSIIFNRDKYTCQDCKVVGGLLHPHHIKPLSELLKEFLFIHRHLDPIKDKQELFESAKEYYPLWETNNGITLCADCHNKKHPDLILSVRNKKTNG